MVYAPSDGVVAVPRMHRLVMHKLGEVAVDEGTHQQLHAGLALYLFVRGELLAEAPEAVSVEMWPALSPVWPGFALDAAQLLLSVSLLGSLNTLGIFITIFFSTSLNTIGVLTIICFLVSLKTLVISLSPCSLVNISACVGTLEIFLATCCILSLLVIGVCCIVSLIICLDAIRIIFSVYFSRSLQTLGIHSIPCFVFSPFAFFSLVFLYRLHRRVHTLHRTLSRDSVHVGLSHSVHGI